MCAAQVRSLDHSMALIRAVNFAQLPIRAEHCDEVLFKAKQLTRANVWSVSKTSLFEQFYCK